MSTHSAEEPALELRHVTRRYRSRAGTVVALDDVDLHVEPGGVLHLVGESGSGKTTAGRVMAGLVAPTSGEVLVDGRPRDEGPRTRVQLVHQDPYASLDPTQRIGQALAAPLRRHLRMSRRQARDRAVELLESVDLAPGERLLDAYPHELSGGQRQRVVVARALAASPSVLVADEAVSMIDVSLRLSLLATLDRLRRVDGVALVFITHDLALARHLAPDADMAVMYLGGVVERGRASDVLDDPRHPYTQALVAASPPDLLDPVTTATGVDLGEPPSATRRPAGCPFHPRCPSAWDACRSTAPPLADRASPGGSSDGAGSGAARRVACHLHQLV